MSSDYHIHGDKLVTVFFSRFISFQVYPVPGGHVARGDAKIVSSNPRRTSKTDDHGVLEDILGG